MYMKLSFLRNFYSCCNVACYRPKTAVSVETSVANKKMKWVKLTRQHASWPSPWKPSCLLFCLVISIFKPGSQNLWIQAKVTDVGLLLHFNAVFVNCSQGWSGTKSPYCIFLSCSVFFFLKVSEVRLIKCSLWLYKDRKRQWLRVGRMMRDPRSPDETLGCQISPIHSIELHYLVLRVVFGWKDRVEG